MSRFAPYCAPWSSIGSDSDSRLSLVGGSGYWVTGTGGERYLDGKSGNLAVTCGYGCQPILEAIERQLRRLPVVDSISVVSEIVHEYATELLRRMPKSLCSVTFSSSGSEAFEAGVRAIRSYWDAAGEEDRNTILVLSAGYHGSTLAATSASRIPGVAPEFDDVCPGFESVPISVPLDEEELLSRLEHRLLDSTRPRVAAFAIEPVLGIGGIVPLSVSFLSAVGALVERSGALLLVDEVLTGMGRCGEMFLSAGALSPDVLLASKGLTSGYIPLSGTAFSERVMDALSRDPVVGGLRYGHTSSGNPVACAAGLAAMEFTVRAGLADRAGAIGESILSELKAWESRNQVVDVRGRGLLIGIEMMSVDAASRVVEAARASGLLIRSSGAVVVLAPPLILDLAGRDILLGRLEKALNEAVSR